MFRNFYIRFHIALIAALVLGILAATVEAGMYNGYETPDYSVVSSDDAFEIRDYAPHVVAEVSVAGTRSQAASRGFRSLANYIFGGNASAEKIAMTAPVSQVSEGDGYKVRFSMPGAYDLDTLPAPNLESVTLRTLAANRLAVIQFSGRWTAKRLAQKEAELRQWASAQGLTLGGEAMYFFYNDPFTLPWKRRNEVALAVR